MKYRTHEMRFSYSVRGMATVEKERGGRVESDVGLGGARERGSKWQILRVARDDAAV